MEQDNPVLLSSSSISPTLSLATSDSSVSSCGDYSIDASSSGRGYHEGGSLDSGQDDPRLNVTGSLPDHVNGNLEPTILAEGSLVESNNLNLRCSNNEADIIIDNIQIRDDANTGVPKSVENGADPHLSNNEIDSEIWLPPEPDDQEDDIEGSVANFYDEDDEDEYGDGMKPISLDSIEDQGRVRYKLLEEKVKAMEEVMNGKFKALVIQCLKSIGVDFSQDSGDSWMDMVTSLSWEAASFVKPDAFEGKAMDPNGYVKIKCIATGSRTQSKVFKGLVFKKHAAHKRMPMEFKKPKLLLIKGALSVSSDGLSSFDLIQQEKERLDCIIGMIEKCHPDVVLVEKTVSRDILESILAKGITLVLEMKLHRLERIARCTGSPILSSDQLNVQKLKHCDSFYFETIVEEHASFGEGGKKPKKTLMFLEGCPKRLGCTILLKGSHSEELKKVKYVLQFAVVMAYHLILESSFLLDQRAMFSTISVDEMANPSISDQPPSIVSSNAEVPCDPECSSQMDLLGNVDIPIYNGSFEEASNNMGIEDDEALTYEPYNSVVLSGLSSLSASLKKVVADKFPLFSTVGRSMSIEFDDYENLDGQNETVIEVVEPSVAVAQSDMESNDCSDEEKAPSNGQLHSSLTCCKDSLVTQNGDEHSVEQPQTSLTCCKDSLVVQNGDVESVEQKQNKDDISTALEAESILILQSTRNAKSGIVCEQSHFSCIKFYRNFDVPLGKFLLDNLLNQKHLCGTCEGPPESHLYFYAHHNKQLTIQVKQLPTENRLAGENEGKLWMWSCCGRCKHGNGSLKSTKRVLVSRAARGLSFGKFLELGFSDHSSSSRLSTCGHSFYRDYLHFFGLGSMVAMFVYSTVATYSVSLPSLKLKFTNSTSKLFLEKEIEHVYKEGVSVFCEVESFLKRMESRFGDSMLNLKGSYKKFSDVEEMLKQERLQFESTAKNGNRDYVPGDKCLYKPLYLNRVHWELLLESCVWDQRLYALENNVDLKTDLEIPVETSDSPRSDVPIEGESPFSLSSKADDPKGWMWTPFPDIQLGYMKDLQRGYLPNFEPINSYTTDSRIHRLITEEGSKLFIPYGTSDYLVSDYEDELSSIIACALASLKDRQNSPEGTGDASRSSEGSQSVSQLSSQTLSHVSSVRSLDSSGLYSSQSISSEELNFSSFDGLLESLDLEGSSGSLHRGVTMGRLGKVKYSVICVYANHFADLRSQCGLSELDYIASLSRCKSWDAKGGKSKSLFSKTLDDRFIIKGIKKTEFFSFVGFGLDYFKYMDQCYNLGNQTCLAKIFGIYEVRNRKTETKHQIMVMENLSYARSLSRQYDLKGALHARFNSTSDITGDTLLDQNFVNDVNVSPLYVKRAAKRKLQRAVWNDTSFLNLINVMDYSLLVGVDSHGKELVCGIIDYVRQYTWDKQLEHWVKSFVVPKNQSPTVISPKEYKKRFRKFIDTHFFSVPDDWCSQRSSNPCSLCGVGENNDSRDQVEQNGSVAPR